MRNVFTYAAVAAAIASTPSTASSDANTTATRTLAELTSGQLCGLDIKGHDVANVKRSNGPMSCMQDCQRIRGPTSASSVTWTNHNGGTCWCKNVDPNKLVDYLAVKPGAITVADKPLAGSARYIGGQWGPAGWDLIGNDIANVPLRLAQSSKPVVNACADICVAYEKCFAVTWTTYNGGTCWLKSKVGNVSGKPNTISGYVVRTVVQTGCS